MGKKYITYEDLHFCTIKIPRSQKSLYLIDDQLSPRKLTEKDLKRKYKIIARIKPRD